MGRAWPLILIIAIGLAWSWSSMGPGRSMPALEASLSEEHEPNQRTAQLAPHEKAMVPSGRVEAEPSEGVTALSRNPDPLLKWQLNGVVRSPLGGSVPNALVALISLHEGRPGNRGDRELVNTDEYGRFSIAIPEWARRTPVLLVARHMGWQSYSEIVTWTAAGLGEPRDLSLRVGEELAGRVMRDGLPVAGAQISVDAAHGTRGVFDAGSEAWWADGQLHEKHGHAQSAADGFFRISGLGPYEHRLEIHAPGIEPTAIRRTVYAIRAPDFRTYDLTSAWLSVRIQCSNGAVDGAKVYVKLARGGLEVDSDVDGVLVGVPPLKRVSVYIEHRGARSAKIKLESPGAGQVLEVTVPFRILERPSITVKLPGATARGIERIQLTLEERIGFSTQLEAVPGEQVDTFVVAMVPLVPERYNLILEPHGQVGSAAFIAPQTKEIQLPAKGNLEIQFALELFGRIRVNTHSARRQGWQAVCRVRDDRGREFIKRRLFHVNDIEFYRDVEATRGLLDFDIRGGDFRFGGKGRQYESADRAAARCGVIPPGTYTLVVESEGHETWQGPLTITAGLMTTVDVQLIE